MNTLALLGGLGPWEALVILIVFGGPLWILPIVLGVHTAGRKGYSPLWMLFGITCAGAWVAYIVIAALPDRRRCAHCGGFAADHWKLCPHCQHPMTPVAPPVPPQPPPTGH